MEGVAFGLRDSVELMAAEMELGEVRVSGGGASSDLWLRIIADVIGLPVRVVGTAESAAHGAAMLAAVGAGAFGSVAEACEAAVELGEFTEPGADTGIYTDVYRVYRDLYPVLREPFHRLSGLDT
jgi:xylulokinase